MSVLLTDGYEERATADLDSRAILPEGGSQIVSGGVCGGQCYTNSTSGGGIIYGVDAGGSPVAQVGMAFKHGDGLAACTPLFIGDVNGSFAAARLAFLRTSDSGGSPANAVQVYTGPSLSFGTLQFTTAANVLPTDGSYVYLELRVLFDDVVGEIDFWVGGVSLFSATGLDTLSSFSVGLPWATAGVIDTNGTGRCVDDFYIMNGLGAAPVNATVSLPGSVGATAAHVVALTPQTDTVAGGRLRGWTPSVGTDHGAVVDETPPNGDTDYVETLVEGAEELFRFPQISAPSNVVFAVQSGILARKDAIGNSEMLTIASEGGAAVVEGERWGVSAENYYNYTQMWDPPVSALPWTLPMVADTEFGMRHTRVRS